MIVGTLPTLLPVAATAYRPPHACCPLFPPPSVLSKNILQHRIMIPTPLCFSNMDVVASLWCHRRSLIVLPPWKGTLLFGFRRNTWLSPSQFLDNGPCRWKRPWPNVLCDACELTCECAALSVAFVVSTFGTFSSPSLFLAAYVTIVAACLSILALILCRK